jgi:HD-GYP domain-containing protein (c-di-GMP phosphodiesterase class II)
VRGDRIHDLARVVAVADVLAGLCAPRAHRPALTREQAVSSLARQASVGALDRAATRAAIIVIGQSAVRTPPNAAAARAA